MGIDLESKIEIQPTNPTPTTIINIIRRPNPPGIPENTVAAMKHALACGADVLEFDVWLTRDQKVVVFHDATLARMCGIGHQKGVRDLAYADLPPIRVDEKEHWGITAANRLEAQRIPLLSEVLEVVPRAQLLIIEFKQKDEVRACRCIRNRLDTHYTSLLHG
jgi:glycerophosphoryl diester phosphodiesterase